MENKFLKFKGYLEILKLNTSFENSNVLIFKTENLKILYF